MATKKTEKGAGPADKGLRVTARCDSFWRGGHQFGPEPRVIPLNELTEVQREQICTEGLPGGKLVVDLVDIEQPAKG
jgi:hypothetical protein